MVELVKTILIKVSFDKLLFQRELRKGLEWIDKKDRKEFEEWCYARFRDQHKDVLDILFKKKNHK